MDVLSSQSASPEVVSRESCPSSLSATEHSLLRAILVQAGVSEAAVDAAAQKAVAVGSDLDEELVAGGFIDDESLARAIAATLQLPYGAPALHDRIVSGGQETSPRILRTCTLGLAPKLHVAPPLETIERTGEFLRKHAANVVIGTPAALRRHRAQATIGRRLEDARFGLATRRMDLSARSVLTGRQGFALAVALRALAIVAFFQGSTLWNGLHATLSLLLCACTLFRLSILLDLSREQRRSGDDRRRHENRLELPVGPMPIYTILVALYREEAMIEPLVASLANLNWPRSRLDIKLICEADDAATVEAVRRRVQHEPGFELVLVPPSAPRTKPKALNHALPLARGDYVVLYDAEDRPDPDQLLEAWLAFRRNGPDLACVQAPLAIRNGNAGWLPAVFALEYAVLFRAILPFLARRALPIPLGGTSNHFRLSTLDELGGWDSYNVAEDADLGIRLARHGYRTETITAPTSEIAPETFRDWRNQRSRWIKGWIQTYLVHMRHPVTASRELGLLPMAAFQLLFFTMIAGALTHTAFVIYLAVLLVRLCVTGTAGFTANWLMAVDLFNIVAATAVFAGLASGVSSREERPLLRWIGALWFYWILVSLAAARSLRQLFVDPHRWDKTPHREEDPGSLLPRRDPGSAHSFSSTTAVCGRSPPSATSSCHSPLSS